MFVIWRIASNASLRIGFGHIEGGNTSTLTQQLRNYFQLRGPNKLDSINQIINQSLKKGMTLSSIIFTSNYF
jgi:hypothetical protein